MADQKASESSTTEGLPVAPSLKPALGKVCLPRTRVVVDLRVVQITLEALLLGLAGGIVARALILLIGLITNLSFYGRVSTGFVSPAGNQLGIFVIVVPVVGAVIVGLMARYGSKGIRGHGIPEAMEQVLLNQSRIPPRLPVVASSNPSKVIGIITRSDILSAKRIRLDEARQLKQSTRWFGGR
jgi:CBS domain-containing protein